MQAEDMIPADEFCIHHNIDLSFIYSLNESGLLEISMTEEKLFVPVNQLEHLERMVRLHNEMDINLEGVEAISWLLQRVNEMQKQIAALSNRLAMYES